MINSWLDHGWWLQLTTDQAEADRSFHSTFRLMFPKTTWPKKRRLKRSPFLLAHRAMLICQAFTKLLCVLETYIHYICVKKISRRLQDSLFVSCWADLFKFISRIALPGNYCKLGQVKRLYSWVIWSKNFLTDQGTTFMNPKQVKEEHCLWEHNQRRWPITRCKDIRDSQEGLWNNGELLGRAYHSAQEIIEIIDRW